MPRRGEGAGNLELSWPPVFTGGADEGHVGTASAGDLDDEQREQRRAGAALQRVMATSARRGERLFNWARLWICATCLVVWGAATLDRLWRSDLWVYAMCVLGIVVSAILLRALSRRSISLRFMYLSVLFDAALAGGLCLGLFVIEDGNRWGMPKTVGLWVSLLTLLASGFRLSRRVAVVSIVAHAAWLIPLGLADLARLPRPGYLWRDWVIFAAFAAAAGFMGFLIASRTRRLSLDVAASALAAQRSRSLLGAYVSEEVADHALRQGVLRLGGERVEAAVLFSDLRDFTTLSESLPPEALVAQLNAYLSAVVTAIRAEGGVVDKYIGDAVMAVFGVPRPSPDDAQRAVRAALQMRQALVAHNAERAQQGLPPLRQGVGVHHGALVAGNVGTAERASFTVIGDTVNVAARLESATKTLGVDILVSEEAARRACGEGAPTCPTLVDAGQIAVKGRTRELRVFTVAGPAEHDAVASPEPGAAQPKRTSEGS